MSTQVNMDALFRILTSLAMRTKLWVQHGTMRLHMDGRCSPYKSHRIVCYELEEPALGELAFGRDERPELIVNPTANNTTEELEPYLGGDEHRFTNITIPSSFVMDILSHREQMYLPDEWLDILKSPLVTVQFLMPVVLAWDSRDHHPIFYYHELSEEPGGIEPEEEEEEK